MESFRCRTKILSGPGSVQELRKLGCKRLLLIADPYFIKNGTAGRVSALTGAQQVEIFDRVQPDPTVELAAEGTALTRAFQPDLMVALGGGSTIDCAKAMRYFAGNSVKLAAIPTTSGSGSEVTDFAILTHDDIKHPLVDKRLQPDMAILDGELLNELPPSLIADSGFDVLSHALEALVATGAGSFTDALSRDAYRIVYGLLLKSYEGDKSVRQQIHDGSCMAGLAFNQAGLGLCHGMSHALGGMFHVPHGRLNAILLPEVIGVNAEKMAGKYAEAARYAGFSGSADAMAVRSLKNGLSRLRSQLGLPATLQQAGIRPEQIRPRTEEIVKSVLEDPCCMTNPVKVEAATVRTVLHRVMGHG